jgi:hypothetical protein
MLLPILGKTGLLVHLSNLGISVLALYTKPMDAAAKASLSGRFTIKS